MLDSELDELVRELSMYSIHSIILFGSSARGESSSDSDMDICVISERGTEVSLENKIDMEKEIGEKVDLSFFDDLPLNVRMRVLREGEILFTKDLPYVYELIKITDFELSKYQKFRSDYHDGVSEAVERRS